MTAVTAVTALQTEIETRLAGDEPEVEVLLAEISGPTLRLFIDHPAGVDLALCERVSARLSDYRERYSLEVSSPGSERPLAKPEHFRRFIGARARVRLRAGTGAPPGHRQLTGELVGVGDADVTLATDDGVVTVAYDQIVRSNLVRGD